MVIGKDKHIGGREYLKTYYISIDSWFWLGAKSIQQGKTFSANYAKDYNWSHTLYYIKKNGQCIVFELPPVTQV